MDYNKFKPVFNENIDKRDGEIDVRELLEKHVHYWKWYGLSIILCLFLAFFYLRYTSNQYLVTSTILIDDKDVGGISSELNAFQDLPLLSGSKTSIINEIGVLKSVSLMKRVVKDLKLNISYYHKGDIVDAELYKNHIPFKILFFVEDSILDNLSKTFEIKPISKTHFVLTNRKSDSKIKGTFGKNIKTDFGEINVTPIDPNRINIEEEIVVIIKPVKDLAMNIQNRITIEEQSVGSSILVLTLKDRVNQKAKDILNTLVRQYNMDAINDKTEVANNTNDFINGRIEKISIDLTKADINVEEFKTKNKLSDMGQQATIILASNSEIEDRIVDLNSQIRLVDYVVDYMNSNPNDLIPSNLGLKDASASRNTVAYNSLIMERNRIEKSSSNLNPTVISLSEQINALRQSIDQSLKNLKASLTFSLSEARNQSYRLNSKISSAPKQERQIRDIQRQQQITETLYLYLLQKREENAISLVGISANAKIIDDAQGDGIPVSPQPKLILAISLILGLIFPFGIISLIAFIDNKIHSLDELENSLHMPILGDIPKTKSKIKLINFANERNGVGEAFRILRTNLGFMFTNPNDGGKTIFVTSTIAGEGKTFISMNLASVLASNNNNNVLLIGADLRLPKFNEYIPFKSEIGLTNYLVDSKIQISDIIISPEKINFDIIQSGAVPPNPADLLMNGRFEEVLARCKERYDYIVVDTPPINLVTDTLLIGKFADLSIYVTRANYLDKRLLKIPKKIFENNRLPNMAILLNATDNLNRGYGYGYGYG